MTMNKSSTSTNGSARHIPTPILLLKTRSTPTDAYADYFSKLRFGTSHDSQDQTRPRPSDDDDDDRQIAFSPRNIPVLENRFHAENIQTLEELLRRGAFDAEGDDAVDGARTAVSATSTASTRRKHYGGLIFTSQRAVEAFVNALRRVVDGGHHNNDNPPPSKFPPTTPIYVVGPATHRALLSSPYVDGAGVYGAETGTGERLGEFIKQHYNALTSACPPLRSQQSTQEKKEKLPLLFLVGEQRRDVIPRILMRRSLSASRNDEDAAAAAAAAEKIVVEEMVVYEASLAPTLNDDLRRALSGMFFASSSSSSTAVVAEKSAQRQSEGVPQRGVCWILVFSPTGCEEVLRALDVLGGASRSESSCSVSSRSQSHAPAQLSSSSISSSNVSPTPSLAPAIYPLVAPPPLSPRIVPPPPPPPAAIHYRPAKSTSSAGTMAVYLATIGPTTRDHLRTAYGVEAHVCACTPTPEGVAEGIRLFHQG